MDRVAIFVDAGYVFAQGSAALTGSKKSRVALVLDTVKAINALKRVAQSRAASCGLLRIYWYDGSVGNGRPTSDQAILANLDDIKLRLGFVNSRGEQKGVDSLIVTDLIELARLKSITDAILVSGDEDVRVGVQIAQNYGVRVHLLGIIPSRGSQSHQLLQEADTTTEWDRDTVAEFLSVRELPAETPAAAVATARTAPASNDSIPTDSSIKELVEIFVAQLTETDLEGVRAYWESGERGVPTEFDRRILPTCREHLGRDLDKNEIRTMRSHFRAVVESRPRPAR